MAIERNARPPSELRVVISSDSDIVTAREQGRALAHDLGFEGSDLTVIATAISELGRNILTYAGSGEILLKRAYGLNKHGIVVVASDQGPGIPSIELAMQDGYSTSNSLGLGLPGVRRLMDSFSITSTVGNGTVVSAIKWV